MAMMPMMVVVVVVMMVMVWLVLVVWMVYVQGHSVSRFYQLLLRWSINHALRLNETSKRGLAVMRGAL